MSKRVKSLVAALMVAAAAGSLAADEAALHEQLLAATWPADIVRLSGEYLTQFPEGPHAAAARQLHERAGNAMRALGQAQVRLYRSAFQAGDAPTSNDELRRAALADTDAAMRLAHAHRSAGPTAHRYEGWLQYASALGSDRAAYELAVHYRSAGQPVLAAQYESQALQRGFVPPTWLDNVRK